MSNIVKNTDNSGGIINQTTIKNYLVIKPKKWLKKTFQTKKYYQDLEKILNKQLSKKVDTFKSNKKYIPDIFLELDNVKEKLRYITQPLLFFQKNLNEIKNIEFHFFNQVLENLSIEKKDFNISSKYDHPKNFSELNKNIEMLINDFNSFKESIPNFDDITKLKEKVSEEQYKLLIKEQGLNRRFGWFLDKFEKKLTLLQKRMILLTEQAGQGKTNLLCDFVENVMLKKNLLGIMLTGNQFNNLQRDSIEEIIIKEVYGFDQEVDFNEFLTDIEHLCKKNNATFTIIIDGLNENVDIKQFSQELYSFVEDILEKDFIRLVFSCRSEYFDDRFKNFKEASFRNKMDMQENYMERYNRYRDELPEHLVERLLNSYISFFQIKSTISDNIRHLLSKNFLLLRMFSEVYGTKDNPNAPIEQVYSIYKDDLFTKYFAFKLEQINKKTKYRALDLKKLFESILTYMINNKMYINISLEEVEGINLELLEYVIDEDIFFRKDLIKDKGSIYANSEVLNFTFDEFRDYLLADYIVNNGNIDLVEYLNSLDELVTIKEGIERYLFLKSRKEIYKEKLRFLEELDYYDNLFLKNIFSVNDKNISSDDINKIKCLFLKDAKSARVIITRLMYRHQTKHYINLNIHTLIEIISLLKEEDYNCFVNSVFKVNYDYHFRERSGDILKLSKQLQDLLETRNFDVSYQLHNVFELMLLLLGVNDDGSYGSTPYELVDLLENYIDKYPVKAKEILLKHESIKINKIRLEIWKLINYYVDKQIDFDGEFYKKTFEEYIVIEDKLLGNNILSFLEKCYRQDKSWCEEKHHEFFKTIEDEARERRKFFDNLTSGKVNINLLFSDNDEMELIIDDHRK